MELKLKEVPSKAVAQIKGGIRKAFRFTIGKNYLYAARIELPRRTKTGKLSVIPDVFYRCNQCKAMWKEKEVQVDHIEPVVPVTKPELEMTVGEYAHRTFKNNCQVLCRYCHKKKTVAENLERKKRREANE